LRDKIILLGHSADDFTTPTSLAKQFVDGVESPNKAFATIKGGHFAAFMNSSEFLNELSALLARRTSL
jgi:hypothetical protein